MKENTLLIALQVLQLKSGKNMINLRIQYKNTEQGGGNHGCTAGREKQGVKSNSCNLNGYYKQTEKKRYYFTLLKFISLNHNT